MNTYIKHGNTVTHTHTHTRTYIQWHVIQPKKDGKPAIVTTWMDPEGMMSSEISQTNERQEQNDLTLMWNIKKNLLNS